jgi:hypothetical protein
MKCFRRAGIVGRLKETHAWVKHSTSQNELNVTDGIAKFHLGAICWKDSGDGDGAGGDLEPVRVEEKRQSAETKAKVVPAAVMIMQ